MSEQLVLDLPHRPALGADDFLVSHCNQPAVDLIDSWPEWQGLIQMIEGPAGSGKSHLANVWRLRSGALEIEPGDLDAASIARLDLSNGIVLEDLDRGNFDETALFHLFNLSREKGLCVLLTSRVATGRLNFSLPDLMSRLRAVPVASIGTPDDALLGAVMLKHFSDRQLNIEPHVLKYLTTRMERSMQAASDIVSAIDKAALQTGKKVTRQFAGEVLEQVGHGPD